MSNRSRVIILSTADFDSPIWTNKQHLALGLAEDNEVIYVESLGLREPTLSPVDLARMFKKATDVVKRFLHVKTMDAEKPSSDIRVISPIIVPFHKYSLIRWFNKRLLHHQLKDVLEDCGQSTLWTFSPLTYGIERHFGQVVYHSVDLLHTVPKIPTSTLLEQERGMIENADYVLASSTGVKDHLESVGAKEVILWENVAHVGVFTDAAKLARKNQVVFAGNLTLSKIDLECLRSILDSGVNLVIAGPIDIDGSGDSSELSELLEHPMVAYRGNLSLPDLALLMGESKVGIIPYQVNEYTRGVFPMKVYEYLAAGLSVVSTPLPSLSAAIRNVELVTPSVFGPSVKSSMVSHDSTVAEASIAAATDHSWVARIQKANNLIDQHNHTK